MQKKLLETKDNMIAFDTYQYVKDLKAAGFTEAQAEVQANWLKILVENDLATKQDLELTKAELKRDIELVRQDLELAKAELKRDIKELDTKIETTKAELKHDIELTKAELQRDLKGLDARIEASKVELLKWLIGLMIAQTGVIIAIVKLMPSVG